MGGLEWRRPKSSRSTTNAQMVAERAKAEKPALRRGRLRTRRRADDVDVDVSADEFRRIFAQDLPRRLTDVMAASQRPGARQSLITASGPPAWAAVPSWYVVAGSDNLIPPAAQRDG